MPQLYEVSLVVQAETHIVEADDKELARDKAMKNQGFFTEYCKVRDWLWDIPVRKLDDWEAEEWEAEHATA
jgi:hypothetical protein